MAKKKIMLYIPEKTEYTKLKFSMSTNSLKMI